MAYIGKAPLNGFHAKQSLTGDGSTVTFTLDFQVANETAIIVSVGGVIQEPSEAYNLAIGGTKITFTEAPASTDRVYIQFLGQAIVQNIQDVNGAEFILDVNGNTSFTADTDDEIDIKVGGSDRSTIKATGFHNLDNIKFVAGTGDDMQMYHDGTNSFLTNSTGALKIATETSGIAITLGHSTSEVTIADNATVTGNLTVTGTLTQTGTQTFDGGIDVDNFNINGTTIALSSGDMLLDSAGDIILDADGGDVFFKDAGTTFGSATNTSGNLIIKSGTTTAATFSGANVTLAGTVGSGAITSTGTVQGTTITATTAFVPDASDGAALGTTALEFSDLFLADGAVINFGADQDINLTHAHNTGLTTNGDFTVGDDLFVSGGVIDLKNTGTASQILLYCESSNAHAQTIQGAPHSQAASNTLILPDGGNGTLLSTVSTATVTNKTFTTPKINENVALTATATELNLLDTASANSVVNSKAVIYGSSGEVAGTLSTAAQANVTSLGTLTALTVDDVAIDGKVITMTGSSSDTAVFTAAANGALSIVTTDAGGAAGNIQITADGTAELAGTTVTLDSSGGITLDADGGTITFADAGSSLGTITSSGYSGTAAAATTVTVTDNESTNENNVITFVAGADSDGGTGLGLESDGNLTYNPSTGTLSATNLVVTGTQTITNSVTMNASNAVVFEGSTADEHETTLTTIDATGDRTISLPNVSGTLPVLAAVSATAITSTPEELNKLDGATVTVGEINLIDGGATVGTTAFADGDGLLHNDNGTMRVTSATTLKTYMSDLTLTTAAQTNITSVGTLTALTVDDITINGSTISDGGDFVLDVGGDITFDAAGADFRFKVDGSEKLKITENSGIVMAVITSNEDFTLRVNDGGSNVDAMVIDSSDTGAATFVGGVRVPDSVPLSTGTGQDFNMVHDGSNGTIFGTTGNITIDNRTNNADIIFKGTDGGADLTALTLDMSAAGAATFNSTVTASGFVGNVTGNASGTALTVTQAAQSSITSLGTLTALTVDTIGIDAATVTASGDLTFDVAADIVLNADGGIVKYQDAAVEYARFFNSSSNVHIKSMISDKDIVFLGNDGGSAITALTLDMSAAGAATFNNDVTAFSDRRLKDNIETIPNALDKVCAMRGVNFTRNDNNDQPGTGVIAQEMQEVFPVVVKENDDENNTLSVSYGNLVGVLIEAIKELKQEIDELKGN